MPLKVQQNCDTSINLTPLIDIVFLLIIFFMVGTKFSELSEMERNIPLQVPSVSEARALTATPKKRLIHVLANGEIILDGQAVSISELQTELTLAKNEHPQLGVVVRGDANSIYQKVAEVIAACRMATISDVNIAVRTAEQSGSNAKR